MENLFSDPILLTLIFFSGLFAGFVNVYAGGGTILTIAILVFYGIPISVANGTNRIGVLAASTTSTYTFFKNKTISAKNAIKIGIWTIPGAITGAIFAVKLDSMIFEKILAVIIVFIAISLFIPTKTGEDVKRSPVLLAISMIFVGIYGGFIQTGVGLIQMVALKYIGKMNLLKTNAYKMTTTLIFTIPAVVVFALTDSILLDCAIVLAVSGAIGGKIGSALAIKNGEKFIKIVMFFVLIAISVIFFLKK